MLTKTFNQTNFLFPEKKNAFMERSTKTERNQQEPYFDYIIGH